MDLGLIGLGKMGGNMRERLRRAGHTVVGYDRNPDVSDADSLEAMVEKLPSPKIVWVMVPAGEITRGHDHARSTTCSARATSSSTAATRAGPTTRPTASCWPRRASASSTAASPAASGAWRTATR